MSQNFSTPVSGVTKFGELYGVITNALNSIRSCFSGAAFPASPVQGQACFRTDTLRFYIYSGSTWVDLTDYLPVFKAVKSEVQSARGSAATLEARLDVALNNDGTLKGNAPASSWWTDEADAVAYVDASGFTVAGDKTAIYTVNRAVGLEQTTDTVGRVTGASYDGGSDLTTVTVDCTVDAGLTGVAYGQPVDNYPAHIHGADDLTSLPTHQHGASDLTSLPSHTHGGADLTDLTGWLGGTGTEGTAAKSDHYHPDAVLIETYPQGTAAGGSTAGTWHTRNLNHEDSDPLGLTSLSAGRFLLGAGKYFLLGMCAGWGAAGFHFARFYNYTGASYLGYSGGIRISCTSNGNVPVFAASMVTLTGNAWMELRQFTTFTQATYGLGYAMNYSGVPEVYAIVQIFKIS